MFEMLDARMSQGNHGHYDQRIQAEHNSNKNISSMLKGLQIVRLIHQHFNLEYGVEFKQDSELMIRPRRPHIPSTRAGSRR